MKPGTDKILSKAETAIARAEEHLASGRADRAMERAYYAIFHAARGVLAESGDRSRSHAKICDKIETMAPAPPPALSQAVAYARRRRADEEMPPTEEIERLVAFARAAVASARAHVVAGSGEPGIGN